MIDESELLTVGGGKGYPGDDGRTGEPAEGWGPPARRSGPRDVVDEHHDERDDEHLVEPGVHGAELLAVAAHDLRSPLATARGFVELLRHRWDDLHEEERRRFLDRTAAHLADLNELLNDLLDVSSWDAGQTAAEPGVFDVAELVVEVTSTFNETNPDRRIEARITSARTDVAADRRHIERVLHNLIGNALRYSPAGSPVDVGLAGGDDEVVIAVRDRGRGISEDDQRHLFRRFSRVSEDGEGSGLGLYICRRLVEAQGGRIWVDSEPGAGSTFTVALPAG